MIRFLKALIFFPIAVAVVLLAVANRGSVSVSLDPFSRGTPEISFAVPLYALVFGAVALGVVLGGVGAWLAQGRYRRDRRVLKRETSHLKAETERLRARSPDASRGLAISRSSGGSGLPALPASRL